MLKDAELPKGLHILREKFFGFNKGGGCRSHNEERNGIRAIDGKRVLWFNLEKGELFGDDLHETASSS